MVHSVFGPLSDTESTVKPSLISSSAAIAGRVLASRGIARHVASSAASDASATWSDQCIIESSHVADR